MGRRTISILMCGAALAMAACGGKDEPAATEDPAANTAEANLETPAAAPATPVASPSFDCAKAASEAEKMVCGDGELAAMDRETARLYALAEATGDLDPSRSNELKATQRGWVKGRDDCWKADDKRACVADNYAQRIHELRQGYANARSDDDAGVTIGPVAYDCQGLNAGISATFVNTDPGAVHLEWLDRQVTLAHVPAASGAKYSGTSFDGTFELWTKGDEATFTMPGGKPMTCRQDDIG